MAKLPISWLYKNKPITEIPQGCTHFVYMIKFSNGDFYIGYKGFYSTSRKKVAGLTRRKVTVSESNWRSYRSSSKDVVQRIKDGDTPTELTILHLCKTKGCATWFELYEMVKYNVLCDTQALNKNILGRFFKCFEEQA